VSCMPKINFFIIKPKWWQCNKRVSQLLMSLRTIHWQQIE
jgi:hypothetical protein